MLFLDNIKKKGICCFCFYKHHTRIFMEIRVMKVHNIDNWTQLIRESQCGNLFQYKWYLDIKNVKDALCVYHCKTLIAVMPLFESNDKE